MTVYQIFDNTQYEIAIELIVKKFHLNSSFLDLALGNSFNCEYVNTFYSIRVY